MSDAKKTSTGNQEGDLNAYVGYRTICESDLLALQEKRYQPEWDTLAWQRSNSFKLKLLSIALVISFILILVWQVLVSMCRVTTLCQLTDVSSRRDAPYLFHTFKFLIPSSLIWLGLTFGSLIFFICSFATLHFMTKPNETNISEYIIGYYVRQAASFILLNQYFMIAIPSFVLFLLLGLTINWSTAGSFSFGAMSCILTGNIATSVCSKANLRSSTGSTLLSFVESLHTATYAATIILLSTMSVATFAAASAYLFYSDIQALAGFIAGSSFSALMMRSISTLYFDAMTTAFRFKPPFREIILPNVVAVVASGVSVISGLGADVFDSFIICIITTAFLGSGLPYFSRDQFALCMFNHLEIDKVCGPFGYPQELSFASLFCRAENLYLSYPSLESSASVPLFVAVPFVLAVSTLLVYLASSVLIWVRNRLCTRDNTIDGMPTIVQFVHTTYKFSVIVALLLIISSSVVFFVLFGPSSPFQNSSGMGVRRDVSKIILDGSPTQCMPRLLESSADESLLPQGVRLVQDKYRPMFVSGTDFGAAESVALRLFACNCIGIIGGVLVILLSYLSCFHPMKNKVAMGTLTVVFKRFSGSLLVHLPVTILVLAILVVSFKLQGAYGVGVAAMGYLSLSGSNVIAKMVGMVIMNAASSEFSAPNLHGANKSRDFVLHINRLTTMSSQIVSNGATTLTAITGVYALVQKSDLWPSPRSLAGSIDLPPPVSVSSVNITTLTDVFVVAGIAFGGLVPFVVGAFYTSGVFRSSLAIYVERRSQERVSVPKSSPFVARTVRLAFQESSFIVLISILAPLCVGFGLGQRALVSMLLGIVGVGYALGIAFVVGPTNQKAVTPSGANKLISAIKQSMGPSLQVGTKMTVAIGLVMSTLMQFGNNNWWIGFILLLLSLFVFILASLWSLRRQMHMAEALRLRDEPEKWEAPVRRVSPFFEEGCVLDPYQINPLSEMADILRYFGRIETPAIPTRVGLRNGSVWTMEDSDNNIEGMVIPQARVPIALEVVQDEARYIY